MRFSLQSRSASERRSSRGRTRAFALSIIATLTMSLSASAAIPVLERDALIAAYNATNGPGWTNSTNWLGGVGTECTWYGVYCDTGQTHVTTLNLGINHLIGTIPSEVGNLTNLQQLGLLGNGLTGTIPSELGNLTNLVNLDLSYTNLTGTIPSELGNLTMLQDLALGGSQLTGTIPTQLGNLTNLANLDLRINHLTGTIPTELGNLTNLWHLYLGGNPLTGTIPTQLGNLTNLSDLDLGGNQLTGTIPTQLGNLTNLGSLYLNGNQLTGTIPAELGNMTNMHWLDLAGNQLTGSIPTQLGNLTNLVMLVLSWNQLTGTIPTQLGNLTNLQTLGLNDNQLTGTIPTELGNLTNLQNLSLSEDHLTGSIPTQLGNLTNLQSLFLNRNQLTGSIPPSIAGLTSLYGGELNLSYNALFASDPTVQSWADTREPGWASTQTIAPWDATVTAATDNSLTVSWTPIAYTADNGFYQVWYSTTAGGPYTPFVTTTSSKSVSSLNVTGLATNTRYYFVVSTTTQPSANNANTVASGFSAEVSGLTAAVSTPAVNAFTANPSTISAGQSSTLSWSTTNTTTVSITGVTGAQLANGSVSVSPAATTTYTLTASGPDGAATATMMIVVNAAALSSAEHNALVDLYNSTNGANWTSKTNWMVALDECTWYGVACDGGHTTVQGISLAGNNLSGNLPASLGNLTGLQQLLLTGNQLSGSIPTQLASLTGLQSLVLGFNQLSGSIPTGLGNLTSLQQLLLTGNQLSGSIPSQMGSLTGLRDLNLSGNQLSGSIPPELGNLTSLQTLYMSSNQLSGNIPSQLGSLTSLQQLYLKGNQLSGSIPSELTKLTSLVTAEIGWNALYSADPALTSFLSAKQIGGDWQSTQTIAPANPNISGTTPNTITVSWTPIAYAADSGFYRVSYSTAPGGPYTPFATTTSSKSDSSLTVTGLSPNTTYYFVVSTTTQPHGNNPNTVTSGFSAEVSGLTAPPPPPPSCPPITLNPALLPNAPRNIPYSQALTASGGTPPYTLALVAGAFGAIPPWLGLSGGTLSGTPPVAGSFFFSVQVTDGSGCSNVQSFSLTVIAPFTVDFPPFGGSVGTPISFTGSVIPATTTIASWLWDFGDGSAVVAGQTAMHAFLAPGSYNVTLSATDTNGAMSSVTKPVFIPGPASIFTVDFSPLSGSVGTPISFTGSVIPATTTIAAWLWDFGDGSAVVAGQTAMHAFLAPGSYNVTLSATDTNGAMSSVTKPVFIPGLASILTVDFSPVSGSVGTPIPFTGSVLPASTTIAAWFWDFGDGSAVVAGRTAMHAFVAPGSYNVKLSATDSTGAMNSVTKPVVITASCPPIAIAPPALLNGTVNAFYSQSLTATGGAAPYALNIATGSYPPGLALNLSGTLSGTPTTQGSFAFTIRATDSAGCSGSQNYTILINGSPAVTSFAASPSTITAGQSSTLSWTTTDATSVSISGIAGPQPMNGSISVSPATTTTYALTAVGPGGSATVDTTVNVVGPFIRLQLLLPGEIAVPGTPTGKAGAPVAQVAGTPFTVVVNGVDLSFNLVTSATDTVGLTGSDPGATLPPNAPLVAGTRSFSVTLPASPGQTITASDLTDPKKSASTSPQIAVSAVDAPAVAVASLPSGLVAAAGTAGATDSYTLINTGGAPTTVTLSQSGNFFTQSPSSFTLQPGATQRIALSSFAEPAGVYEGASIPSGPGVPTGLSVPVRLLSAIPVAGTVGATPAASRTEVSAPVGTNPTGTVAFMNSGTATLLGILISDSRWLIPQAGVITIPPGETVTVSFTIDRSLQPAGGTAGSTSGTLSLVFVAGTGAAALSGRVAPNDSTPQTGQVSVSVVDVAKPPVTAGTIPPLGFGEVALLVGGLRHGNGVNADLAMVNTGLLASLNDLKLYYVSPSSASQVSSLGQLPSNISVSFADVVKSVFGHDGQTGGVLLRSTSIDVLSVSARRLNTSSPRGTYASALPVFRSDRSMAGGDSVFLAGLKKGNGLHTNVCLQEAAGAAGSVKIDFLDAHGTAIGTRSDALAPFAFLEIADAAPAGAAAARITSLGPSQSRIAAYALAIDETTGDSWSLVDWNTLYGAPATDPSVLPLAGGGGGARMQTDLALVNKTAAVNRVTLKCTMSGSGRHRIARKNGNSTGSATTTDALIEWNQTIALDPLSSTTISDLLSSTFALPSDSVGYLTITPAAGMAITARTYKSSAQPGTAGTGVAAIPVSSTLTAGQARYFAGIEDASPASITASAPATYRTNLGLIETAGQPVSVRVTMRYYFPAGLVLSGYAASAKDFTLSPGQFLLVTDAMTAIIGDARSSFGDLHNVQVEIRVTGGNGRVLGFIQSIDNGTGDTILRTD